MTRKYQRGQRRSVRRSEEKEEQDDRPMTVQDGVKLGEDIVDLVVGFLNFWRS